MGHAELEATMSGILVSCSNEDGVNRGTLKNYGMSDYNTPARKHRIAWRIDNILENVSCCKTRCRSVDIDTFGDIVEGKNQIGSSEGRWLLC